MIYLLAQAATTAADSAATKPEPFDPRPVLVWVGAAVIVGVITLAIWAMTRARTPLAGDHH